MRVFVVSFDSCWAVLSVVIEMRRLFCLVLCAGCVETQAEPTNVGMTEPVSATPIELRAATEDEARAKSAEAEAESNAGRDRAREIIAASRRRQDEAKRATALDGKWGAK